jgi:hypothetical protein
MEGFFPWTDRQTEDKIAWLYQTHAGHPTIPEQQLSVWLSVWFRFARSKPDPTAHSAEVPYLSEGPLRRTISEYDRLLRDELPQFYRPRMITGWLPYVHQTARFRGEEAGMARVEIFGAPPDSALDVPAGDSLEAGLFFHDRIWQLTWLDKQTIEVGPAAPRLSYRVELLPGRYFYTLEARQSGPDSVPRPLARKRLELAAEEFPRGRLALSDLLLADQIAPLAEVVASRDDVHIVGSPSMVFQPGDTVHVYFEVYGLQPDAAGTARFRAELAVTDSVGRRSVVERIGLSVQRLLRRDTASRPGSMSWNRTVVLNAEDDRVPEFLALSLPPLPEGLYRITLTVTDLNSDGATEASRLFTIRRSKAPSATDTEG